MSDTASPSSIEAIAASTESSTSTVHEALATERRRVVLRVLSRESPPLDVSTIARAVVDEETDAPTGSLPQDLVEEVRVLLYHVHLPKLAELGFVQFEADDGVFSASDELDDLSF